MLSRLTNAKSNSQGRVSQLPQRRWTIRAVRTYFWGALGAVAFSAGPFIGYWVTSGQLYLLLIAPLMLAGWFFMLPRPLLVGLDERGIALIIPGWTKDTYLWIPLDRLVRLEIRQGWLMATGTTVEQQGNLNWVEAAELAGAIIPPWITLHFKSTMGGNQIAAPIYLLDELSRDEIELWLYRQGKG